MVERRKAELRAEREARLAEALRRNLRRRKEAGGAAPVDAPAGALPDASDGPGPQRDEPQER